MTRAVRISEPASEELVHAVHWYETRRPGLGAEFFDAVVDLLATIEASPEIGPMSRADPRTRRVLIRRFPYQIVYRLTASDIIVVAVAHLKRRPGYWKSRP